MARRRFTGPPKKRHEDDERAIEMEGTVVEKLPNARFKVKLDDTEHTQSKELCENVYQH